MVVRVPLVVQSRVTELQTGSWALEGWGGAERSLGLF